MNESKQQCVERLAAKFGNMLGLEEAFAEACNFGYAAAKEQAAKIVLTLHHPKEEEATCYMAEAIRAMKES